MSLNSKIQWTDHTWNVATGCTKVDEDCKYCYMYRQSLNATRFNPMEVKKTKTVFKLPLKIKEPSKIFTSSFTDFFHKDCDAFRNEAWDIIRQCPQHTFQILTKRPERILHNLPEYWDEIKDRVWLGTSIGGLVGVQRLYQLLLCRNVASVLFLSIEPLWQELFLDACEFTTTFNPNEFIKALPLIDWVIVGGESGNDTGKYRYRTCQVSWIERIVKDCKKNNVAVFVKQLGTHLAKEMKLSDRHGGNIDEFPSTLQIREFPKGIA